MGRRPLLPALLLLLAAVPALLAPGCVSPGGPDRLEVAAADYTRAFDAAVIAARAEGLPAVLRDRRAGIIETDAAIAASVFEPWRGDGATPDTRAESTVALHRRRVRFEFTPIAAAGAEPEGPGAEPDAMPGPDVLGLAGTGGDRTTSTEPLELTVSVWVERADQPGLRRDTWTRRATTRMRVGAGPDGEQLPARFWTPVARDRGVERRLLAAVDRALVRSDPGRNLAPRPSEGVPPAPPAAPGGS